MSKRIFKNAYKDADGNFVLEDEITPWQELKIKKLVPEAVIPSYAYDGESVGLDLVATSCTYNKKIDNWCYETGLAIALEKNEAGLVLPCSRNRNKEGYIPNTPGLADPGYTGPITLNYKNRVPRYLCKIIHVIEDVFNKLNMFHFEEQLHILDKNMLAPYKVGDVVGQLVIVKVQRKKLIEVDKLPNSKRMNNGHGSTLNYGTNSK